MPKDTTVQIRIQNGSVMHFEITNITESGNNLHIEQINQLMFKGNADLYNILNYASEFKQ